MNRMQKTLSSNQLEAFYHDDFVEDQVKDFVSLLGAVGGVKAGQSVIDIGGGVGYFARRLSHLTGARVTVLDSDAASVAACRAAGIDAVCGDALSSLSIGEAEIVCFNLILHHLVGQSEKVTLDLQRRALAVWHAQARFVFVHEYIYESYFNDISGWLIFQITKSKALSRIGRLVSRIVPAFRANTFSVGVRFRAHREWLKIFESVGYTVESKTNGRPDGVSLPLRSLLIKSIRRDSFLLRAADDLHA